MAVMFASAASSSLTTSICNNVADTVKAFGSYVIVIIGIILIIVGILHVVNGFIQIGKAAWLMTIGTLLFGGFLTFGGWIDITGRLGSVGKNTLENLMGNMTPTTHSIAKPAADATDGLASTQTAINTLADSFFLPFGKMLAVCVGVILVIYTTGKIAAYFMAKGQSKMSLPQIAITAVLGSILFTATPTDNSSGWQWISEKIVGVVQDTVVGAAQGDNTDQTSGLVASITNNQVLLTISNS